MTQKQTKGAKGGGEIRDPLALDKHLARIETQLEKLSARGDVKSLDRQMKLTRIYNLLLDSKRKQDKEANKRLDGVTRPLVFEWFRQQSGDEQRRVVREMELITSKRSGLA